MNADALPLRSKIICRSVANELKFIAFGPLVTGTMLRALHFVNNYAASGRLGIEIYVNDVKPTSVAECRTGIPLFESDIPNDNQIVSGGTSAAQEYFELPVTLVPEQSNKRFVSVVLDSTLNGATVRSNVGFEMVRDDTSCRDPKGRIK